MNESVLKVDLERRDAFVRHTFQLLVTWFTVFITVNWATMGWLAHSLSQEKPNPLKHLPIVSGIFAFQTLLGIIVAVWCGRYFISESKRIIEIEQIFHVQSNEFVMYRSPFPKRLYVQAVILMVAGLVPIAGAWIWWLMTTPMW